MLKADLLAAVAAKKGFVRVISDSLAPDNIAGDTVEKRRLLIEHNNADGTAGITNVFYLHNTSNDDAKFYNVEPSALDNQEPDPNTKKLQALEGYLSSKYAAYFIGRVDLVKNWAEADVFTLTAGKLAKKSILIFKQGANPINDLDVTIL